MHLVPAQHGWLVNLGGPGGREQDIWAPVVAWQLAPLDDPAASLDEAVKEYRVRRQRELAASSLRVWAITPEGFRIPTDEHPVRFDPDAREFSEDS